MAGHVIAVARDSQHRFSKRIVPDIRVLPGLGVEGDAHQGPTVKHRSRVAADPAQLNLRQVHLIHSELFDELSEKGFVVRPAEIGENITTRGIDLLGLPQGSLLKIGTATVLEVTGLRNPCAQIERFMPGLLSAVLEKGTDGKLIRKTGVMSIVLAGGVVQPGDSIEVELPPAPHLPLERV